MPDLPHSSASPTGVAARGRVRLLVVDDHAVNRQVVRAMLTEAGYAVQEACDGAQALAALAQASFDAVLMDCEMPVLDGYAAAAELRRREGDGPRTPIIALTASTRPPDVARARAAGMDRHVPKPITIEVLHAAVAEALGETSTAERPMPAPAESDGVLEPQRLEQLRRLYPDERRLREFAALVFDDSLARIAGLATAARAGDSDAVGHAAHVLQTSCALIGAQRAGALLGDIERRARAGEVPCPKLVRGVADAWSAARDALSQKLG